jgi:hypothetical protein
MDKMGERKRLIAQKKADMKKKMDEKKAKLSAEQATSKPVSPPASVTESESAAAKRAALEERKALIAARRQEATKSGNTLLAGMNLDERAERMAKKKAEMQARLEHKKTARSSALSTETRDGSTTDASANNGGVQPDETPSARSKIEDKKALMAKKKAEMKAKLDQKKTAELTENSTHAVSVTDSNPLAASKLVDRTVTVVPEPNIRSPVDERKAMIAKKKEEMARKLAEKRAGNKPVEVGTSAATTATTSIPGTGAADEAATEAPAASAEAVAAEATQAAATAAADAQAMQALEDQETTTVAVAGAATAREQQEAEAVRLAEESAKELVRIEEETRETERILAEEEAAAAAERAQLVLEAQREATLMLAGSVTIQARWRGRQARILYGENHDRGWAAIAIQARFRGMNYRVAEMRGHNARVQAVQEIQRRWRGGRIRAEKDQVHGVGEVDFGDEDDEDLLTEYEEEEDTYEIRASSVKGVKDDAVTHFVGTTRDLDSLYLLRHPRRDFIAQGLMLKLGGSKFKKKWEERVFVCNSVGLGWYTSLKQHADLYFLGSLGYVNFSNIYSVEPISGMMAMVTGKLGQDYSDHGLEIITRADKTGSAKDKDKTFYLACPTKQSRDEWVVVFANLIPMTPAERKAFRFEDQAGPPPSRTSQPASSPKKTARNLRGNFAAEKRGAGAMVRSQTQPHKYSIFRKLANDSPLHDGSRSMSKGSRPARKSKTSVG